jgi:uncharacterized protein YjbI with pentapeptide repeats
MGCDSRPRARAKPLAGRYITHSKFKRADYYEPILEALCAFVRDGTRNVTGGEPPAADIQAALTIIGKGRKEIQKTPLNLSKAHIPQADLSGAHLPFTNLQGVVLSGGAFLVGADLSGTDLVDADLREALLSGADLRGAQLNRADLRGAQLVGSGIVFNGLELHDADLSGADLSGADLRGANVSPEQLKKACGKPMHLDGSLKLDNPCPPAVWLKR